jgi:hypothetical protein
MIIGLSGYAQSGKDTVAKILVDHYGFRRLAFADPIREMLYEMNPKITVGYDIETNIKLMVDKEGWEETKQNPDVRRLLQNLGVAARKVLGEEIWVGTALRQVWGPTDNVVISDVRFKNEADMIKQIYGLNQLWRVIRPGTNAVNDHISEHELDDYEFDFDIYNETNLLALHEDIEILMEGVRV